MEESWEDLLCRVYYAGYEDCQRERDYDPMGNKVVDTARIRVEKIEQRIRALEAALATIQAKKPARADVVQELVQALAYMVNHAEWRERNEGIYWEATEIARAALTKYRGESNE